jgi:hypothetical protein
LKSARAAYALTRALYASTIFFNNIYIFKIIRLPLNKPNNNNNKKAQVKIQKILKT